MTPPPTHGSGDSDYRVCAHVSSTHTCDDKPLGVQRPCIRRGCMFVVAFPICPVRDGLGKLAHGYPRQAPPWRDRASATRRGDPGCLPRAARTEERRRSSSRRDKPAVGVVQAQLPRQTDATLGGVDARGPLGAGQKLGLSCAASVQGKQTGSASTVLPRHRRRRPSGRVRRREAPSEKTTGSGHPRIPLTCTDSGKGSEDLPVGPP